jgi:hypothetical protein
MNRIALEAPAVNPQLTAPRLAPNAAGASPAQVRQEGLEIGPSPAQLSLQPKGPLAGRPADLRQSTLGALLGELGPAAPAQERWRRALRPNEVADRLVAELDDVLGDLPHTASKVRRRASQVSLSPGTGIPQAEEGPIDTVKNNPDLTPRELGIPQGAQARLERLVAGGMPTAQIGLGLGCPAGLEGTEKSSEKSHPFRQALAGTQGGMPFEATGRRIRPPESPRFSLCPAAILSYND